MKASQSPDTHGNLAVLNANKIFQYKNAGALQRLYREEKAQPNQEEAKILTDELKPAHELQSFVGGGADKLILGLAKRGSNEQGSPSKLALSTDEEVKKEEEILAASDEEETKEKEDVSNLVIDENYLEGDF